MAALLAAEKKAHVRFGEKLGEIHAVLRGALMGKSTSSRTKEEPNEGVEARMKGTK
jgi:hypothetical protein